MTSTNRAGFTATVARQYLRGWWAFGHLMLNLWMAMLHFLFLTLVVSSAALVTAGIGVVMILGCAVLALGLARIERSRIAALLGVRLTAPILPAAPWWRRWLANPYPWLAMAHSAVQMVWGLFIGMITTMTTAFLLCAVALGFIGGRLPTPWQAQLPFGLVAGHAQIITGALVSALLLIFVVPLLSILVTKVDVLLARSLIAVDERITDLTERVGELTTTREKAVDSVELERRRIERDLHDGPQQRLVAIAMDLGMAKARLDRDVDGARALIEKAHAAAKEAIVEMRQVARGIHPPVLTDRGLDAALSALADRHPLPVEVTVNLSERPSPTLEAIAYFCASEALTNVAKHSGATRASVVADLAPGPRGALLNVQVRDDGRGGAATGRGTGLSGLHDRLRAVDGWLTIDSPIGGPTLITATMPWAGSGRTAQPTEKQQDITPVTAAAAPNEGTP